MSRRDGVRPLVRRAWHAVGMARTGEALLIALAAGLFAAAAALRSGVDSRGVLWAVALLAALPMGAAWLLEQRPVPVAVARRIDRRLRLRGALVSAWEVEERGGGQLGLLLGAELRRRLRLRQVLAAALPNSIALLALPLLGVVLLVLALEARPGPQDPLVALSGTLSALSSALGEELSAALGELDPGALSPLEREEVRRLEIEADRLAGRARSGLLEDDAQREGLLDAVERLRGELDRTAAKFENHPRLCEALEAGLALLDGLEEPPAGRGAPTTPAEGEGAWGDTAATDSPPDRPGGKDGGGDRGGPGLARGSGDGTIPPSVGTSVGDEPLPPSPPTPPRSTPPDLTGSPAPAGGVALGAWWPEDFDSLVSAYVEERRGARAHSDE